MTQRRTRIPPRSPNKSTPEHQSHCPQVAKHKKDTEQLWSPALRRARKAWKKDRDVIEEFAEIVTSYPATYPENSKEVSLFLEIVEEVRRLGYKKAANTAPLAEWIRAEKLKARESNPDANYIALPKDLQKKLDAIRETTESGGTAIPYNVVFRDSDLFEYAKQRVQLLHGSDDLSVYLEGLVRKEQSGLNAPSGSLFDLIETCEGIVKRNGFRVAKDFAVNTCDLWVPDIGVAIEPRIEFEQAEEGDLFRLLTLSTSHFGADHLVVVVPDELEEDKYQSCRSLKHIVDNLTVVRVKDFEKFFVEVIQATSDAMAGGSGG